LTLSHISTVLKVSNNLNEVYERLKSGERLSMAMSMEEGRWDSTVISRVAIAEKNGVLNQALSSITSQLEHRRQMTMAHYVQALKSFSVLMAAWLFLELPTRFTNLWFKCY